MSFRRCFGAGVAIESPSDTRSRKFPGEHDMTPHDATSNATSASPTPSITSPTPKDHQGAFPTESDGSAATLSGPGWMPRWATTSELELYNAEAAILGPIRPMICQRTVAGLNTIASLHEKVRRSDEDHGSAEGGEGISSSPATTATVPFYSALPNEDQKEVLSTLDADDFTSIVFVHGYAGGVANWLPIWKAFAAGNDVYAFDLPGFARSVRKKGSKPFNNAQDAINWYVGQFERWFEAMKIGIEAKDADGGLCSHTDRPKKRKLVLVGHSFGGYLCSQFTMRHPEVVDHLVLVDSWGVHRHVPLTPVEEAKKKAEQSYASIALSWAMDGIYWSKLLRGMGPAARTVFAKARPEFMDTWSPFLDDPTHFYDYTYHCNAQTPHIGERAFARIRCAASGPFAAQRPLYVYRARFPRTIPALPPLDEDEATVSGRHDDAFGAPLSSPDNTTRSGVNVPSEGQPSSNQGAGDDGARPNRQPPFGASSVPSEGAPHLHVHGMDGAAAASEHGARMDVISPLCTSPEAAMTMAVGTSLPDGAEDHCGAASNASPTTAPPRGRPNSVVVVVGDDCSTPIPTNENASCRPRGHDRTPSGMSEAASSSLRSVPSGSNFLIKSPSMSGAVGGGVDGEFESLVIEPYPQHMPPREGFKMTMLYGETSWLRSSDVEDLGPLLRREYGTDVTYHVIANAGHMVMVDNAADFTTTLQGRL